MSEDAWKEAFMLFSNGGDTVTGDACKDLIWACGRKPMLKDMEEAVKGFGGKLTMDTFLEHMKKPHDDPSIDEFKFALDAFDSTDSGFTMKRELMNYLCNMGEKMQPEEVEAVLKDVPLDKENKIETTAFCDIFGKPVPAQVPNIEELLKQL